MTAKLKMSLLIIFLVRFREVPMIQPQEVIIIVLVPPYHHSFKIVIVKDGFKKWSDEPKTALKKQSLYKKR